METATDFSQNITKQLTNTLYEVSLDGHTNVLYMNAITGDCRLIFDTKIAIDNVMIKYHNTIENDDMAILEFNYLGKHTEVLLRNGEKVSEDMDNVSMFYSITDISENLFSYFRGEESNVIDRFGTNKFERYHNQSGIITYVSDMINHKNIIICWRYPCDGSFAYNIYDIETNKFILDKDVEMIIPTKGCIDADTFGFVVIKDNIVTNDDECYMIDTHNNIISHKFSCDVNFLSEILIDKHNNQVVSFDDLEDYLDGYGDMLKEEEKETNTDGEKLVSLLNCIKAKGMPKQVIICSENAVRAYSEIKKLEIKDKKLFIENCLCEFNNDEQVNFIY